jgi:Trk-type K+ transport system membrane component
MTTQIIIGGYIFFVVVGIIIWLLSRRPNSPVANVAAMIDRIMHHRTTRVAIMLGWWWVGWHFLVNVVHR